MRVAAVQTWAWAVVFSSGCFGDAPNFGGSSTGGTETSNESASSTGGTTRPDDVTSTTSAEEVGEGTATGSEATSSTSVTTGESDATGSESHDTTDGSETSAPEICVHHVFVTSEPSTADLGGLMGADARCNDAGEALGGVWVAVLSDGEMSAKDRIDVTGGVCDLHGVLIAHDEDEWWSGAHLEPINITEQNEPLLVGDWRVWTGTAADGESTGGHCNGWTVRGQTAGVTVGDAHASNQDWVNAMNINIQQCGFSGRLYCFRQSL